MHLKKGILKYFLYCSNVLHLTGILSMFILQGVGGQCFLRQINLECMSNIVLPLLTEDAVRRATISAGAVNLGFEGAKKANAAVVALKKHRVLSQHQANKSPLPGLQASIYVYRVTVFLHFNDWAGGERPADCNRPMLLLS